MKRILITTLLACLSASPASFGGIGDTYYCKMVEHIGFHTDELVYFTPEPFTFRWKRGEIVFGKGGFFSGSTKPITDSHSLPTYFHGGTNGSEAFSFNEGRFRWTIATNTTREYVFEKNLNEVMFVTADCSKFDD